MQTEKKILDRCFSVGQKKQAITGENLLKHSATKMKKYLIKLVEAQQIKPVDPVNVLIDVFKGFIKRLAWTV